MAHSEKLTYVLLLVEDNIADAELVQELLEHADPDGYAITKAERMATAVEKLKHNQFDVVLLDLGLPDAMGVETVRAIRAVNNNVPIVVLTGNDNEELGLRCIDAGAQDFLSKNELTTALLRRAIGYALVRQREAQLREMQQALA